MRFATAVTCFEEDWEASIAHLRLSVNRRKPARNTNMLERLFEGERRRTKTIPYAFNERATLKLMYAALVQASDSWNGMKGTECESRQLQTLREDLERAPAERNKPVVACKTGKRPPKFPAKLGLDRR